jgi:hypothetical protein
MRDDADLEGLADGVKSVGGCESVIRVGNDAEHAVTGREKQRAGQRQPAPA